MTVSDPNEPVASTIPISPVRVNTAPVTRRMQDINRRIAAKPDLELVEVTAVTFPTITVRKIGTTTTIPNVVPVGHSGTCTPDVGDFVWIMTPQPGAQPIALGVPAPKTPCFKAYLNTNVNPASNVLPGTTIAMDANWTYEYKQLMTHDFVTNNTRVTCQRAGIYQIECSNNWNAGGGVRAISILINGVGVKTKIDNAPSAILGCTIDTMLAKELIVGTYVEFAYVQNTGGALQLNAGIGNTYLSIVRLADLG